MCEEGNANTVGCYTNAWLSFADQYGPNHPSALECLHIVTEALDAAKTSVKVATNRKLLEEPKPHYLVRKSLPNHILKMNP